MEPTKTKIIGRAIKLFYNKIFHPEEYQKELDTILITASHNKDFNNVKEIIEIGADVNAHDGLALVFTVQQENLEGVKFLKSKGADLSINDYDAFLTAISKQNLEIIKYFVENGADVNYLNGTALTVSAKLGNIEIVKYLIEQKAKIDNKALKVSAENGHLEIVKLLIHNGASLETQINTKYYYVSDWIESYKKSKEMFEDLNNNLSNKEKEIKRMKI